MTPLPNELLVRSWPPFRHQCFPVLHPLFQRPGPIGCWTAEEVDVIRHYHKSPNEPFLSFTPGMGDQIERSARCENRFPLRGAGGHENNRWPIPRVNRREVQRSLSHWQGASMIPILGVGAIRFGGPRFRAASVLQVGTVARKRDPPNTDLRCGAIWFSRAEVREGLATPVGARPADLGVGEYQSRGSATFRIPI